MATDSSLDQLIGSLSNHFKGFIHPTCYSDTGLGGGKSNMFGIFTPKFGEDSHFDEHIFQRGGLTTNKRIFRYQQYLASQQMLGECVGSFEKRCLEEKLQKMIYECKRIPSTPPNRRIGEEIMGVEPKIGGKPPKMDGL